MGTSKTVAPRGRFMDDAAITVFLTLTKSWLVADARSDFLE